MTRLTARERQVGDLLAEGMSNKEIGVRLGISERGVIGHLTRIFSKLGVENRVQAAVAIVRAQVAS